ncbi:hypothetical protein ACJX0J_030183 [Zea mays]
MQTCVRIIDKLLGFPIYRNSGSMFARVVVIIIMPVNQILFFPGHLGHNLDVGGWGGGQHLMMYELGQRDTFIYSIIQNTDQNLPERQSHVNEHNRTYRVCLTHQGHSISKTTKTGTSGLHAGFFFFFRFSKSR